MTPGPSPDTPEAEPTGTPSGDPASGSASPAVDRIVERFGGIRPMAHKLDIPVTTVQGWKKRGAIPANRHADLRAAALRHGIAVSDADLDAAATAPAEERPATGGLYTVPPPAQPVETGERDASSASPDAPSPAAAAPAAAVPTTGARRSRLAGSVAVVALLVGALALTQGFWGRAVPGWPVGRPAPAPEDTAARTQIRALEDRLAALGQQLEARPAAPAVSAADLEALARRVAALEARPAPVAASGDTAAATVAAPAVAGASEADLRALSDRIATLEQRPPPAEPAPDPRIGELSERVAALTQASEALRQRLSAVGETSQTTQRLEQQVGALRQQVGSVEQSTQAQRNRSTQIESLVLASSQLRTVAATAQPFAGELRAVRALGVGDPEIAQALDAMAPHAASGVPSALLLTDRFETLAGDIVRAARKGEGGSWIAQVTGTLSTLVTVRQQGAGVVGDSAEAVVARAEAALRENDLRAAVREVEALQGPAAAAAAGWLADARARLAVNEAAQRLGTRAIALLAGSETGAPK